MIGEKAKVDLVRRLRRIEGQVAGVRRMVEKGEYCVDILLQISAAQGALGQVGKIVLGEHIATCVADAFRTGSDAERRRKIDELLEVFARYGRGGRR